MSWPAHGRKLDHSLRPDAFKISVSVLCKGLFAWKDWVSLEQRLFSPSILQECPTIPSPWRFCRWRRPYIFGPWPRREREKAPEFGTRFRWCDWRGLCKVCTEPTEQVAYKMLDKLPRLVLKSILNSWNVQGIDCTSIVLTAVTAAMEQDQVKSPILDP